MSSAVAAAFAAALFVLSLFCANRLLLSLPGVVQRTDETGGEDILMQGTFNGVGWRVSLFARAQNQLFLAGVLALVGWLLSAVDPRIALVLDVVAALVGPVHVIADLLQPSLYKVR